MQSEMKRDIKSIILLLATQGMINLGEINDPLTNEVKLNLDGAEVFIELLEELEVKTKGNLTAEEEGFLADILGNIKKVYDKKLDAGG
jgi:hypothetical protein